MALADPIAVTYNAVVKNLNRINQDSYGSVYYLDDSTNSMKFTLTVKHTIPASGMFPESHLMRLDVEYLDANGKTTRVASSWNVLKTDIAPQDLVSSQRTQAALLTAATTTNTDKLLGRQS